MKATFTALFLSFLFQTLAAQPAAVKSIREHYYKLAGKIKTCNETDDRLECGVYLDEVNINAKNGSWRAVGIFNYQVRFWYDDQPGMADCAREWCELLKIEVDGEYSVNKVHAEFFVQGRGMGVWL